MVKVKFTLSIGYNGKHEDIVDYEDEEFEGMDEAQIDDFLDQEWREWASNYVDGGYHIIDGED